MRSVRLACLCALVGLAGAACGPSTMPTDSGSHTDAHDVAADMVTTNDGSDTPTNHETGADSPTGNEGGHETGTDTGTDAGNDVVGTDVPHVDGADIIMTMDVPTMTDTGTDVINPTDTVGSDVPVSGMYGPCTSTANCGAGNTCLTFFGPGLCSVSCTTDTQCGTGVCVNFGTGSMCLPQCTSGDGTCGAVGGACSPLGNGDTRSVCFPSCWPAGNTGEPAGYANCPSTNACEPFTGLCGGTVTGTAVNGGPCTANADCKSGLCIMETDSTGAPSGYIGGFCYSFGLMPAFSAYQVGQPIPQSNCPAGSAAYPSNAQAGDSTYCWATCDSSHPCRSGYACTPLVFANDAGQTSNGLCFPDDCSMGSMPCPSGYSCTIQTTDAGVFGVCGACSGGTCPDAGTTDAGSDATTDTGTGATPLFGSCTAATDCMSGVCDFSYPGAFCTQTCTSSTTCGTNGVCAGGYCLPSCTSGGLECNAFGGACSPVDTAGTLACLPSCFTSSPPTGDNALCNFGLVCDSNLGSCATSVASGAAVGAGCTVGTDCASGVCEPSSSGGTATGYLGGYCFAFARVPALSLYAVGQPLPQSNCPSGSVALYTTTTPAEGDSATCFLSCTSSAQCRAGYSCSFLSDGAGGMSSTGYCAPIDCSMSGMTCPSGTTCMTMTSGGVTYGVCG